MNKMKVIDLLNMISKGEEVPLKIEYKGEIYNRQQNIEKNSLYYYQVLGQCKFLVEQLSSVNDLIDEVEILEEEKKIPEKLNEDFNQHCNEYLYKKVEDKVNEIIYYLKSKEKGE